MVLPHGCNVVSENGAVGEGDRCQTSQDQCPSGVECRWCGKWRGIGEQGARDQGQESCAHCHTSSAIGAERTKTSTGMTGISDAPPETSASVPETESALSETGAAKVGTFIKLVTRAGVL